MIECLRKLLASCGPTTSLALTGGLLRLFKELSGDITNAPSMTFSLAVMRRLCDAASQGQFCDSSPRMDAQAADVAHHMLHTSGEARCAQV
jgi:hypothetical protein